MLPRVLGPSNLWEENDGVHLPPREGLSGLQYHSGLSFSSPFLVDQGCFCLVWHLIRSGNWISLTWFSFGRCQLSSFFLESLGEEVQHPLVLCTLKRRFIWQVMHSLRDRRYCGAGQGINNRTAVAIWGKLKLGRGLSKLTHSPEA